MNWVGEDVEDEEEQAMLPGAIEALLFRPILLGFCSMWKDDSRGVNVITRNGHWRSSAGENIALQA